MQPSFYVNSESSFTNQKLIFIVIPCYNEGQIIEEVIDRLLKTSYRIVVVNDASTDATQAILSKKNIDLINHPVNLGQGGALQTGITYALDNGAEYIITFDADGQHDEKDIPKMLEIMEKSEVDVVLGSRFIQKTQNHTMPLLRKMLLKMALIFTKLHCGLNLTDVHNGFRVFRRNAALQLDIQQNRMAHASEILDIIAEKKLSYKECFVNVIYTEYSKAKGQSNWMAFKIMSEIVYGGLFK